MMGRDHIPSGARPFGKSFSPAGFPPRGWKKSGWMRVNGDQSQHSSTFVNFFRRVAPGPNPLIPLGKAGIRYRSDQRPEEKPNSSISPVYAPTWRRDTISESQKTSTFVTFTPRHGIWAVRKRTRIPLSMVRERFSGYPYAL